MCQPLNGLKNVFQIPAQDDDDGFTPVAEYNLLAVHTTHLTPDFSWAGNTFAPPPSSLSLSLSPAALDQILLQLSKPSYLGT